MFDIANLCLEDCDKKIIIYQITQISNDVLLGFLNINLQITTYNKSN